MAFGRTPMRKNVFFFAGLALSALMLLLVYNAVSTGKFAEYALGQVTSGEVLGRVKKFQQLINEKASEGADVSRARELDQLSRDAFKKRNYEESLRLLNEAIAVLENSQAPDSQSAQSAKVERDYFCEVHLEPGNATDEFFNAVKDFVSLADRHKIKLTLLFSPQWADMVLADPRKMQTLELWKGRGHEIGGHHHGPDVWPWDGFSDLPSDKREEARTSRPSVPGSDKAQKLEKYRGNMAEFTSLLNKTAGEKIKVVTMSNEAQDWPEGVPYAGGGRSLAEAISIPRKVTYKGHEVIKVTTALLKRGRSVVGKEITIDELKKRYVSAERGVFGVISHDIDYKQDPRLYEEFFAFLNSVDPEGRHSFTISEIVAKHFGNAAR